ncbi:DUF6531 domain-containing protein [Pedococcus sp. NPDC057267]|uniref:DUF6531 domain-containing protein n=1 Tax=Pedococcus sp. NPDC057267 TaxID=3346077 RepID=UPI003629715A
MMSASTTFDAATAIKNAGLPTRTPVTVDLQMCFTYTGGTTPGTTCTWPTSHTTVTVVPHAFGSGYPTAAAGPGQAALFTGEFTTSTTDVSVPGYSGPLTLSRSQASFNGDGTLTGWPTDPATGVFGPGWTANLDGPSAGTAGMDVADNTSVDGTVVLLDTDGSALVFQHPQGRGTYAPTTYVPLTQDTKDSGNTLTVAGTGSATRLTLTEPDGTKTAYAPAGAVSTTAVTTWTPDSVTEPGQNGASTYGHDATGRVTRIVAAVPDGMTGSQCPTAGTLARGCRAMDITYATTTSTTFPGDVSGQVKSVTPTMWDPGTAAMKTVTVATYAYDSSHRLASVTNPVTGLTTGYSWDGASTRIASITPTGLAPYRFTYDASQRLAQVTRDPATTGGSSAALASFVYGIDPTITTTGLPSVQAATVGAWNQRKTPATGYAVFGPDHPVTSTSPAAITASDWPYADLSYVDDQGYTVNTASYGAGAWQLSATDYTALGNISRTLDAAAINTIQAAATAGSPMASAAVDQLSTQTAYTPDELSVTDVTAPQRLITLTDGRQLTLRPRTHTDYDAGAPNGDINPATGGPYRLPTTTTITAVDSTGTVQETTSTTTNSYDKLSSTDTTEGDGWALGTPVKITTGTGAQAITRTTRYDTQGRVTQTRQPASTGTDAGTTRTAYYTAGTNTEDSACGGTPEWAGLTCRTYPAAAPTSGPTLPDSRITAYSYWLTPATTLETSGTATRTTTITPDAAGRPTKAQTTSANIAGSTSRPATFTHYDPATGLVDYTGPTDPGAGTLTSTAKTAVADLWGRQVTYRAETPTAGTYDTTNTTYAPPWPARRRRRREHRRPARHHHLHLRRHRRRQRHRTPRPDHGDDHHPRRHRWSPGLLGSVRRHREHDHPGAARPGVPTPDVRPSRPADVPDLRRAGHPRHPVHRHLREHHLHPRHPGTGPALAHLVPGSRPPRAGRRRVHPRRGRV